MLCKCPPQRYNKKYEKALYFLPTSGGLSRLYTIAGRSSAVARLLCHEHRLHGGRCLYGAHAESGFLRCPRCLWKRADCVKEETFVSRAQAICDSLGVTAITFPLHELSVEGDRVKFSYTIAYAHGEDFTVENTITLHMLQEERHLCHRIQRRYAARGLYHRLPHRPLHPQGKAGRDFLQRTRRPLPSIPIRIPSPSPFRRSWMSIAPSMPLPHSPA